MNTRILLSPALGVANEKLETEPEEMDASLSLYEIKIAPKISADEFGDLFIESVEQTLTDLLGVKVREALLDYLARHDRLARADMPEHPLELSILLEKILGKSSINIQRYIMRRLYAILEWEYKETSNLNFANQVEEARARWKTSQDTNAYNSSIRDESPSQVTSVVANRPSATTNPRGNQSFGTFLIEAIDQTLMELLGAKVSAALWSRLNKEMPMVKNDIPQHVHKLVIFLEKIMGTKPSKTVERYILRRLYAALQQQFHESLEFDFQVEVEKVRVLWDERQ